MSRHAVVLLIIKSTAAGLCSLYMIPVVISLMAIAVRATPMMNSDSVIPAPTLVAKELVSGSPLVEEDDEKSQDDESAGYQVMKSIMIMRHHMRGRTVQFYRRGRLMGPRRDEETT